MSSQSPRSPSRISLCHRVPATMAVARDSGDDSSQASGSQELKTSVTFALRDAEDKNLIQEARSLINKQKAQ